MGVLFGLLLECRVNLSSTDFNGIQAGKGGHCGVLWSIIRIRTKKGKLSSATTVRLREHPKLHPSLQQLFISV